MITTSAVILGFQARAVEMRAPQGVNIATATRMPTVDFRIYGDDSVFAQI